MSRPLDVWVQDYREQHRTAKMAYSVRSMLEATQVLWKMNMSAEFVSLFELMIVTELAILFSVYYISRIDYKP